MGQVLAEYNLPFVDLRREVFIETGTGGGDTLDHAVKQGFKEIHTIELIPFESAKTRARFSAMPHVHFWVGRSVDILPQILTDRPTTFWLDAHFTGGGYRNEIPTTEECPLIEELKIINRFRWTMTPAIVIDDIHMFGEQWWQETPEWAPVFTRESWPTLQQIKDVLFGWKFHIEGDPDKFGSVLYAF